MEAFCTKEAQAQADDDPATAPTGGTSSAPAFRRDGHASFTALGGKAISDLIEFAVDEAYPPPATESGQLFAKVVAFRE